jgi:release factor glutamine methyltransferase
MADAGAGAGAGALAETLACAGFVAADEEARELVTFARGDEAALAAAVRRRLEGEPLAWVTGRTSFDGVDLVIHPGVYVPRWQSTELARRASACLPEDGTAVDLCTGSGALACALRRARPRARVVATDVDGRAVACARANGVEPLSSELRGDTDVVVAVTPYVPTAALALLPRDTLAYEDAAHYDGGADGTDVARRVAAGAPAFLRPGGSLLLEVGGDQAEVLGAVLEGLGYAGVTTWADEDGDLRGLQAVFGGGGVSASAPAQR